MCGEIALVGLAACCNRDVVWYAASGVSAMAFVPKIYKFYIQHAVCSCATLPSDK